MLVPISILIYLYLIYHITSSILITCIVFGIILIARHIYLLWSGPQKPSSRAEYESIPPARIDGWGETATSGTSRRIYATPTSMAFAAFHYHTFLFRRRYSPRDPIYNTSHLVHAHMHPYLRMSATQLAAALRRKEITCVELIKLYIEHILKVNRYLNAMVHHRFDLALREATAVDHVLSTWNGRKELPQFLGVPCSVKECLEMEGFPNTSGLLGRTPLTATSTSPVIARMQKAGFIVMGTTNTSELCMWYESNNPVYGCTLNPYDLARISGGSSGGEGSIIGACGVPCGVGSDVGGSIRMPAYFNGIFGHKPTGGTVPNTGQHPKHVGAIERYCQAGPMCRYAEDLWPMLKLLAGPDHTNNEYQHIPGWLEDESMVPENVDMSSLTVLSLVEIDTWMITGLDPELKLAQEHAVEHFRSLGAQIKHIRIDEMRQAFVYWSAIVSIEHPIAFRIQLSENLSHHRHWYTRIVSSSSIWIAYELFTLIFQYPEKSAFTFPALFLSWLEIVPEWFPHQSSIEAARGRMFVSQLQSMMMGEKHVDDIHDLKPGHDSWGNIKQQRQATKTCSIVSNVNFHPPPKPKHTHHHTILLAPSHPVLTPRHHWSIIRPFNCMYTAIFNVAQLPVTQVPLGLSKPASGSLPLGVQVVGAFGMDHVTIACALELERKFGGYAYPRATRV